MYKDFYQEIKEATFKPITFGLYNHIDDDMIVSYLSKKNKKIYGIDDFVYYKIELTSKEQFLLSMHNKEFLSSVTALKNKLEGKDCVVDVNYGNKEINVIKLNEVKFE